VPLPERGGVVWRSRSQARLGHGRSGFGRALSDFEIKWRAGNAAP
jgi:hypothetical protein